MKRLRSLAGLSLLLPIFDLVCAFVPLPTRLCAIRRSHREQSPVIGPRGETRGRSRCFARSAKDTVDDVADQEAEESWLSKATATLQRPFNVTAEFWGQLKAGTLGVVVGVAVSAALITVPYAALDDGIQKSLAIFENVLLDLDRGYVEPVAVESLTETAISAMLRTLDPYTEWENAEAASGLKESVSGRYAGVGLVIAGDRVATDVAPEVPALPQKPLLLPPKSPAGTGVTDPGAGGGAVKRPSRRGVSVVAAFEGYAFDAGLRVGDRIVAVDGKTTEGLAVDKVRDMLRGEPDTQVVVSVEREVPPGTPGGGKMDTTLQRQVVRLRDSKLTALLGPLEDGIGYIQLSGFSKDAGRDVQAEYASLTARAPSGLRALLLDLRGNPGGLLESAVDVAALLVPEGSDIVSARGRSFDNVLYRSAQQPMLIPGTRLVILTDSGTASAAEIVSGAVQDLDAGVVVGSGDGRTYGKGLVQSVSELPFRNALKYTVAKYYTPSGRCIQSVNYRDGDRGGEVEERALPALPAPPAKGDSAPAGNVGDRDDSGKGPTDLSAPTSAPAEVGEPAGGGSSSSSGGSSGPAARRGGGGFKATKVVEADRKEFRTAGGRLVRDGGGIEADVKVQGKPLSALEIALQVQGAYYDYAGRWASRHTFSGFDVVDPATLADFKTFVLDRQRQKQLDLGFLYADELRALEKSLSATGLQAVEKQVKPLGDAIVKEMLKDFDRRADAIKARLEVAILSRYLPESMVLKHTLRSDTQVQRAIDIVKSREYETLLQPPPLLQQKQLADNAAASPKIAVRNQQVPQAHRVNS